MWIMWMLFKDISMPREEEEHQHMLLLNSIWMTEMNNGVSGRADGGWGVLFRGPRVFNRFLGPQVLKIKKKNNKNPSLWSIKIQNFLQPSWWRYSKIALTSPIIKSLKSNIIPIIRTEKTTTTTMVGVSGSWNLFTLLGGPKAESS